MIVLAFLASNTTITHDDLYLLIKARAMDLEYKWKVNIISTDGYELSRNTGTYRFLYAWQELRF